MVVGTADFFVACLDWRPGGCGGHAIRWHVIIAAGWYKTLIFIVVAPIMGLVLAFSSWSPSSGFCAISLPEN